MSDTASNQPRNARGRMASRPQDIPAKGWKDILWRVKDELARDHVGLVAAGVAFYGLLAIFPGITAIMAIAGLVAEPSQVVAQLQGLTAVLPQEAAAIIIDQAKQVAGSEQGGLGLAAVFGILLAIYSASKGLQALMEGMNIAYDEEERRGFFRFTLVKLSLTLGLILGFFACILVAVGLPLALSWLPWDGATEMLVMVLRWPVLLLIAVIGMSVAYRYGPSRDAARWRWITPGAGLACVLWLVGTAGFAIYVRTFGSYGETFGALGGVIIMLMWLWLSAYIVLLGAELDSEMEAQTRRDTTTGPDMPMGERGAVKADNLGARQD